ncbi:hypothetical protein BAUCODRAFT_145928 [Baudoinia panamericana UAMH 10762]|uniref:Transcriptional regulator Ngg1 n=1 Tax=Baudoinia panamericana (strain UAMH 10762) TaxID=717646 RepID=M2LW87_BAUPA|nr:uncharacterized protein BAUCODRAFT_145928 [Baudoinia panamericana UAMH 10762]EMC98927.1 hypothetical protein BAUCODRAFT_145928 [Baudoinia panamericana UAMH 10762]
MPPSASKKGTAPRAAPRDRRSSSRHSTPVSSLTDNTAPPTPLTATPTTAVPVAPKESAYLHIITSALVAGDPSIEQLLTGTSAKGAEPPSAKELHGVHDRIRDGVNKFMGKRNEVCDRGMRQLAVKRKERLQLEREEEERELVKKEQEEKKKKAIKVEKAVSRKRSHDEMELDSKEQKAKEKESLPSVGAHGLARQDGVGVHEGAPPPPSPPVQPGIAIIDPMDTAASPADADSPDTDPPTVPLYERMFGKDPTNSDDPTIYDIRPITPNMSDDDVRDIVNVLHWPKSDLKDLTAGDPPDLDLSNAKPTNQVAFSTFQTYVEPFIRPFTEEDVSFLKERGDRVTPYIIPNRGTKSYKDVWAAEDGLTGIEPPAKLELSANEARGSMDDMDDNTAETDEVSLGPATERLMALLRAAPSGNTKKEEDADGDTTMGNGDDTQDVPTTAGATEEKQAPATCLPPEAPRLPNAPPMPDFETLDQRLMQELRYAGLIGPTEQPNYDAHADDEVAARLRTLQAELRRVARLNNIRKARVLELTEERMAMQEYSNIADDLDNQVNAAYLKRNRSLASKPSKKGANKAGQRGVAGVGMVGQRGVSDGVRALMQKRRDWIEMVGPVVKYGRAGILGEGETVFDEESLRRCERGEREAEVGEGEGE